MVHQRLSGSATAAVCVAERSRARGLANVLTYCLVNPPGLTAGDLLIVEPGNGLGDVIRFNPGERCTDGSLGCLVFYSASPPFDSLADTLSPLLARFTQIK